MSLDDRTSSAFMPPPPLSMDGYLDQITLNKVRDVGKIIHYDTVDQAIARIAHRQNFQERVALWTTLKERFRRYGEEQGWLADHANPKHASGLIARIIMEEVLLFQQGADAATIERLKAILREAIEAGLNQRGHAFLEILSFLYDFSQCETAADVQKLLLTTSIPAIAQWSAKNREELVALLKHVGLGRKGRQLLAKRLALVIRHTKSFASVVSKLTRFNFYIIIADIMFSSEQTADDETEARLGFLYLYNKVLHADIVDREVVMYRMNKETILKTNVGPAISRRLH